MVTGLLYIHILDFVLLSRFGRCKDYQCSIRPKFEVVGGCWRSLIGGLHLDLDLKIIGFVTLVVKVEIVLSEALAQISGVGLLRVDVALVGWAVGGWFGWSEVFNGKTSSN